MPKTRGTRVLGIDASLRSTGLGVVEQQGTRLSACGVDTVKVPASRPHSFCLCAIQNRIEAMIESHEPDVAAIEGGFHLKNARTAMVLGAARGVVIAACAARDIPIYEYAPRRVKLAIVGTGSAHKEQVGRMIATLLGLDESPQEDAADALAVAICHLHARTGLAELDARPI